MAVASSRPSPGYRWEMKPLARYLADQARLLPLVGSVVEDSPERIAKDPNAYPRGSVRAISGYLAFGRWLSGWSPRARSPIGSLTLVVNEHDPSIDATYNVDLARRLIPKARLRVFTIPDSAGSDTTYWIRRVSRTRISPRRTATSAKRFKCSCRLRPKRIGPVVWLGAAERSPNRSPIPSNPHRTSCCGRSRWKIVGRGVVGEPAPDEEVPLESPCSPRGRRCSTRSPGARRRARPTSSRRGAARRDGEPFRRLGHGPRRGRGRWAEARRSARRSASPSPGRTDRRGRRRRHEGCRPGRFPWPARPRPASRRHRRDGHQRLAVDGVAQRLDASEVGVPAQPRAPLLDAHHDDGQRGPRVRRPGAVLPSAPILDCRHLLSRAPTRCRWRPSGTPSTASSRP